MPVVDVKTDRDNLSLTIVAEFAAGVERLWEVYADPRQLEQVWGPPEYPATFVDHDLTPGGRVTYYMTGPDGDRYFGYWEVAGVVPNERFEFADGFADADFTPNPDLPLSHNSVTLEPIETGTRATYVTTYASESDLQQVLDMGMVEGSTAAIGQLDAFLA